MQPVLVPRPSLFTWQWGSGYENSATRLTDTYRKVNYNIYKPEYVLESRIVYVTELNGCTYHRISLGRGFECYNQVAYYRNIYSPCSIALVHLYYKLITDNTPVPSHVL